MAPIEGKSEKDKKANSNSFKKFIDKYKAKRVVRISANGYMVNKNN